MKLGEWGGKREHISDTFLSALFKIQWWLISLQSKRHIENKWHYYTGSLDSALIYFLINKLFPHVSTLLMIIYVQQIPQLMGPPQLRKTTLEDIYPLTLPWKSLIFFRRKDGVRKTTRSCVKEINKSITNANWFLASVAEVLVYLHLPHFSCCTKCYRHEKWVPILTNII